MTKEISRNRIGKKPAIADSACTPSILPITMELIVFDASCRMLVAIIGIRKTRKTRQSGFDVSRRTEARGLATAVDIGAFRTAIELEGPHGGLTETKRPAMLYRILFAKR